MNADAYNSRQRQRDAEYRRGYEAWIASLSPEERRRVKALGVDVPFLPGAASGMSDAASSSRARCEAAEIEDDNDDSMADSNGQEVSLHLIEPTASTSISGDDESIHDLLRRLVGELVCQDHAKLSLECLALVTGLTYDGNSMTEIARRHGVTRAAVSKRCVELTQALNLKPSRAMRTQKARQSYRNARTLRLRRHA